VDQAIVGAVWRLWPRAQIEDTPLGQSRLTSHELVAGASLNCIFSSTPTVVAVAVAVDEDDAAVEPGFRPNRPDCIGFFAGKFSINTDNRVVFISCFSPRFSYRSDRELAVVWATNIAST